MSTTDQPTTAAQFSVDLVALQNATLLTRKISEEVGELFNDISMLLKACSEDWRSPSGTAFELLVIEYEAAAVAAYEVLLEMVERMHLASVGYEAAEHTNKEVLT